MHLSALRAGLKVWYCKHDSGGVQSTRVQRGTITIPGREHWIYSTVQLDDRPVPIQAHPGELEPYVERVALPKQIEREPIDVTPTRDCLTVEYKRLT